ncbi:hypothetical protein [Bacillus massilinigeriensis]|uniref:hypothetical protein n=1 Tax=Bacillus mediterraneensis TaxID=1805474 RepID=UPI0008F88750|nr:hypothetical protein [Bacillus mediterraneensis]
MNKAESNASKEFGEASNLPKTTALQDEFTRKFMDSPKQIKDGYYLFKSKTGGYEMLFPKNAKLSAKGYEKNGNGYEALYFGETRINENLMFSWDVTYEDSISTQNKELNLNLLSDSVGYQKKDYDQFQCNNKNYYYAKEVFNIEGKSVYTYFSFIKNVNSNQAIRFYMETMCKKTTGKCKVDQALLEEEAKLIMKSIQFYNN